jgi:alpha-beta hydrolase superfamily lysophospholipase
MRAGGAKVELVEFEGADHFLFFSHEEAVLSKIEAWVAARMGKAP